jgi:two-component system, chemotaxis family, sensor kinase CheA
MSAAGGELFIDEARELLEKVENDLLALEGAADDPEQVATLFRALHTLKGAAAMYGCEEIAAVAHEMETLFEQVRAGRLAVGAALIDLSLHALDHLKVLVARAAGEDRQCTDVPALLVRIRDFSGQRPATETALPAPVAPPSGGSLRSYRIRFSPPADIFQRGLNPLGFLHQLYALGECLAVVQTGELPELGELDPQRCYLFWDLILTTAADVDTIRDIFIFIEDGCRLTITLIDEESWPENPADYKRLGEILVERGDLAPEDLEQILRERKRLGESLVEAGLVDGNRVGSALAEQQRIQELRRQRQEGGGTKSLRVNAEKLDHLVNLVGELVTIQARLSQTSLGRNDPELVSVAEEVERLTWALRDQVLNIRMLPIGTTFGNFRRMVRDLGAELGKEVELVTAGGETELDKTVLERLHDPLAHLIRNCIGHGIESPAERLAAGKANPGRIYLSAHHAGSTVQVQVKDDGRGLDREGIRAKAMASGLLAPETEMGERELFELIFAPGFTTAATVTNVSGRGVGMDVVRQAVDGLRARIDVASTPGKGTTFTIELPLTLAIIDGLLVNIGGGSYVLPLSAVEECIELKRQERKKSGSRNLVFLRDELIPFIRLRERFGIPGEAPEIEQIVIATFEERRIGFVVDSVVGENQTVIKSLGRLYREARGLSGATILGDGSVALILDLPQLVQMEEIAEGSLTGAFAGGRD